MHTPLPSTKAQENALLLCKRFEKTKNDRAVWESDWQDIVDLARPTSQDFRTHGTKGEARTRSIFDGTAPDALEQFAAALHSYLTNPADRWFNIEIENRRLIEDDIDSLRWLDEVSERIYLEYSKERGNFNPTMHEAYLDIGAFGTCCVTQQWDAELRQVVFRVKPIANVYVLEDHTGRVDTVFEELTMTGRQLEQKFGKEAIPDKVTEADGDREWKLVHGVFPRADRNALKLNKMNMKYVSVWFLPECKHILKEDGYRMMPDQVARWSKMPGESYGRSPAKRCLPDIKMVNEIEKTLIKAAQKAVDPPLQATSDGFLLPISVSPNSIIFREQGVDPLMPLEHKGNIPVGIEIANQKREHIRACFHSDWIKLEKETVEMTAYETAERREEKLRLLAPMLGRLQNELLGGMIGRTYALLAERGEIPPPPASFPFGKFAMAIDYSSPASRAQTGIRAHGMNRYLQEVAQIAAVNPEAMDVVDVDSTTRELARLRGVPGLMLRSKTKADELRAARAEQAQQQQMLENAKPVSEAMQNVGMQV